MNELSTKYHQEKVDFLDKLKSFASSLGQYIEEDGEWTIRGFIDIFERVFPLSTDTKLISKLLELHIFPYLVKFANANNLKMELAEQQNYYPDITFISNVNSEVKFAVDLKTTYRDEKYPDFCNGFTLGSHGEYFCNRASKKNIQYPYREYVGHFVIGIIYTRNPHNDEKKTYSISDVRDIPSVAKNFTFFAEEKWKIASDKGGSGNTANIGSIEYIPDILAGNGVFAKAGEDVFDDYWINYGKIQIPTDNGKYSKITTLKAFVEYRKMNATILNPKKERSLFKPKSTTIYIPPIKIQGIKTKIVPSIIDNVRLNPDTVWIEPFMGSGVVGFNIAQPKALFGDTNPYLIQFYNDIKKGVIDSKRVREFLEEESPKLSARDDAYYYEVRNRFNTTHTSLDFLFLNRACFNGMMRFNKAGDFNVPYCHKPNRFSKAYITKIVNQVKRVENLIRCNDWDFVCQSFQDTIEQGAKIDDVYIYCDPPYIDRNADYYDGWSEQDEIALRDALVNSQKPFMLSTWDHNKYRHNDYLFSVWGFCDKINISHFYHVGATEDHREPMIEALLTNG